MSDELRDILEKLYHAPKMNDLNPVAWKNVHINNAIKDIKKWVLGLLKLQEERILNWDEQYGTQRDGAKIVIRSICRKIEGEGKKNGE